MTNMNPEILNRHLAGQTIVKELRFETEMECGNCNLDLHLTNNEMDSRRSVILHCGGVSELCLKGFGGGVTQILCLRARSISHFQSDRINYIVEDLERGDFHLKCLSLELIKGSVLVIG